MYVSCGFADNNCQVISICIKIFYRTIILKGFTFHADNREVFCGTFMLYVVKVTF